MHIVNALHEQHLPRPAPCVAFLKPFQKLPEYTVLLGWCHDGLFLTIYLFHVAWRVGVDIRDVIFHMCIATVLAITLLLCLATIAGVMFVFVFIS